MSKRVLITGVTGQDGYLMARDLLFDGYEVGGIVRGQNNPKVEDLKNLKGLNLFQADLIDCASLQRVIEEFEPDQIYNFAAISQVPYADKHPELTQEVNFRGFEYLLKIVSRLGYRRTEVKIFQASSALMFGESHLPVQSIYTSLNPSGTYAVSKYYALDLVPDYLSKGMWIASAFSFPHESTRRGKEFLTRKLTNAAARCALGLELEVKIGNLEAKRDWGWAPDFMGAYRKIMELEVPQNFVVGTGVLHTVRDVAQAAFKAVGLDYQDYVREDAQFNRNETTIYCADIAHTTQLLGWKPTTSFESFITHMALTDFYAEEANLKRNLN